MPDYPALLPALTLRQIQYFVVLAHSQSFTQAAQALSVTQPALTTAIRQIEFLLGGRLFERSSQRLTLTVAGATVLPLAEHLLNTAHGTFDDMLRTFAEKMQTIRIGLIPSVAGRLFPALAALRAQQPGLRFDMTDMPNSVLVEAVRNGSLDFGIGVRDEDAEAQGMVCQDLFEDEIVVVVRREDPLTQAAPVTWAHLAERELAVFVRGNVSDILLRTGGERSLRLQPSYRMEYTEPLYALVRSGIASAVMPKLYTLHLHDPALVALPIDAPHVTRSIALIALDAPERSPHVVLARDWVAENI